MIYITFEKRNNMDKDFSALVTNYFKNDYQERVD